jgi:hypothetical protein
MQPPRVLGVHSDGRVLVERHHAAIVIEHFHTAARGPNLVANLKGHLLEVASLLAVASQPRVAAQG